MFYCYVWLWFFCCCFYWSSVFSLYMSLLFCLFHICVSCLCIRCFVSLFVGVVGCCLFVFCIYICYFDSVVVQLWCICSSPFYYLHSGSFILVLVFNLWFSNLFACSYGDRGFVCIALALYVSYYVC